MFFRKLRIHKGNEIMFLVEIMFLLFANRMQRFGKKFARSRVRNVRKYPPLLGILFFFLILCEPLPSFRHNYNHTSSSACDTPTPSRVMNAWPYGLVFVEGA